MKSNALFAAPLLVAVLSAAANAAGSCGTSAGPGYDLSMTLAAPPRIELRADGTCWEMVSHAPTPCPASGPIFVPAELSPLK